MKTPISRRIEGGHWLMVDDPATRHVVGCHCGFVADPDESGYGDSVIDHIESVVRAECAQERRLAWRGRNASHEKTGRPRDRN